MWGISYETELIVVGGAALFLFEASGRPLQADDFLRQERIGLEGFFLFETAAGSIKKNTFRWFTSARRHVYVPVSVLRAAPGWYVVI